MASQPLPSLREGLQILLALPQGIPTPFGPPGWSPSPSRPLPDLLQGLPTLRKVLPTLREGLPMPIGHPGGPPDPSGVPPDPPGVPPSPSGVPPNPPDFYWLTERSSQPSGRLPYPSRPTGRASHPFPNLLEGVPTLWDGHPTLRRTCQPPLALRVDLPTPPGPTGWPPDSSRPFGRTF